MQSRESFVICFKGLQGFLRKEAEEMNMIGSVKLFGSKDGVADHTEIFFYDDTDQPVPPDEASRILIRESRKDGTVLKETWAFCQYDHKETA